MEATDLRIGNVVNHRGDIVKVWSLSKEWLRVENAYSKAVSYDFIFGIPLTEEILLKCGLALRKDKVGIKYFKNGQLYFLWVTDHLVVSYLDSDGTYVDIQAQRIYHVHHLQNYYRDLTGEELTVNLWI